MPDFRFSREDRHRAVLADMDPGADFGGRCSSATASAASADAPFLGQGRRHEKEHHHSAAERLEEIAAGDLQTRRREGVQSVKFRLQNLRVVRVHLFCSARALSLMAAMMR